MKPPLQFEPLAVEHLDELAGPLHHLVYRNIEDPTPTVDEFKLGLSRALKGPGPDRAGQQWLNFLVRDATNEAMLGRLEATVHDELAEVAFSFGPASWGRGIATESLGWLRAEVARNVWG